MKIHIFDNNILRIVTGKGNYQKYCNVYDWLYKNGFITDTSLLVLTPGGLMEYLGRGNLHHHIAIPQSFFDEVSKKVALNPADPSVLFTSIARLFKYIKDELRRSNLFSKKKLFEYIVEQQLYTDERLYDWVQSLLKEILLPSEGRKYLISRLALDTLQKVIWPEQLKKNIYSYYLLQIYDSYLKKKPFNTSRAISYVISNFFDEHVVHALDFKECKLSKKGFQENVDYIKKCFNFNIKDGQFLDSEILTDLVVGRIREDKYNRILFVTCERIDHLLVRLLFYKWAFNNSYEHAKKSKVGFLKYLDSGVVVVFSQSTMKAVYKFNVDDIPEDIEFIKNELLSAWVEKFKKNLEIQRGVST